MAKSWLAIALLIAVLLIGVVITYRAVWDHPLPQVQPTLDISHPTQPVHELAPTPTPTP